MKKAGIFAFLFSLAIIFSACSSENKNADDIYSKIHSRFYDIESYNALCEVTNINAGGETQCEIELSYNKENNIHKIVSDGMTVEINGEKTVVSKGDTSIETQSQDTNMLFFPETFFASYYEAENTSLSVMAGEKNNTVLLECDIINSSQRNCTMKMKIDKKTVKPLSLRIYDSEGNMHTEVIYKKFSFK